MKFFGKIKEYFIKAKTGIENSNEHKAVRIAAFFMMPFIILLALEIMHLSSINAVAKYFKDIYWPLKMLFTYTFILIFQCIFYTLFRNSLFAYIMTAVFFYILSLVTYVLGDITGDPLLPSDLLLIKNVKEIASFVEIPFSISYIISFAVLVLGGIVLWFVRKKHPFKMRFSYRLGIDLAIIMVFCVTVYAFCINYNFRHKVLDKINVQISAFNPIDDLHSNGVVLTFFPRIGDLMVEKPEEYSEQAINDIYEKYKDVPSLSNDNIYRKKPNVIIIQNEAWWDPTKLENVEFSEDPMKEIKALGKRYLYGNLVSPVYAGGTCMPEFECLTGYSTAFLPGNSYPYIQHILKESQSLVTDYKNNGYETVAMHPYFINFYNRNKAYPLLGFDKVIGISDMPSATENKKGWYVSDDYAMSQIISAYENKTSDNFFCFMVTMQNHGAYNPARYEEYDIDVKSDVLSEQDLQGLKDYTQGVKDSNDAFIKLTEYFKNVSEPTIIAMYGDHLPLLGTEGSTYIKGEMAEEGKPFVSSEYDELYYTPYIVWSNYNIRDFDLPEYISAGNLGLFILEKAGLNDVPWYHSFMRQFYREYPVYLNKIKMNADGEKIDKAEMGKDFKLLQCDLLHFNRYAIAKGGQQTDLN